MTTIRYGCIVILILFSSFLQLYGDSFRRSEHVATIDGTKTPHNLAWGLRRLIGSNCLEVERGSYPPFYQCIGCVIEEAQACVEDMRYNRSFNVPTSCALHATSQKLDSENCCPVVERNAQGAIDLKYIGAAYPMALRCIESVGCRSSTIYAQLMKECRAVCPFTDERTQQTVCLAAFNEASTIMNISGILCLCFITISTLLIHYQSSSYSSD